MAFRAEHGGDLIGGIGTDIFVFTRDAAKSIQSTLVDFDHTEDRIVIDGVEIDPGKIEVVDDRIDLVIQDSLDGAQDGLIKFDLWGELFE